MISPAMGTMCRFLWEYSTLIILNKEEGPNKNYPLNTNLCLYLKDKSSLKLFSLAIQGNVENKSFRSSSAPVESKVTSTRSVIKSLPQFDQFDSVCSH